MSRTRSKQLHRLEVIAQEACTRAHAPYSGRQEAASLLLSDGTVVLGVRVETASFSLVIPAILNAVTSAVAAGRTDVVAAASSVALSPADTSYLAELPFASLEPISATSFASDDKPDSLPVPGDLLDPVVSVPGAVADRLSMARSASEHAIVPHSAFPVGCLLVGEGGGGVTGVNVEHPDWTRVICAERNAVGTAVTYGITGIDEAYVTCPRDRSLSPCGACRQVLAELAPSSTVLMDRGDSRSPERRSIAELIPAAFTGDVLRSR